MSDAPFKSEQQVMVLDMLINGTRRDISGHYIKPGFKKDHTIRINTVHVDIPLEKIVDFELYWTEKNKGERK